MVIILINKIIFYIDFFRNIEYNILRLGILTLFEKGGNSLWLEKKLLIQMLASSH